MNEMRPILVALAPIYGGIVLGYLARRLHAPAERSGAPIMRWMVTTAQPVAVFLGLWGLSFAQVPGIWKLPVGAVLITLACGVIGALAARAHGLSDRAAGAYVICAMFSNVGATFGGLLCLLFLQKDGFALSQAYAFYFPPFFFTVGFAIARRYAGEDGMTVWQSARAFVTDPVRMIPTSAFVLGFIANRTLPVAPAWTAPVVKHLVVWVTLLYSFAVGVSLHLGRMTPHLRACASQSAIKFVATPLLGIAAAWLLGCTPMQTGVMFVEASAPAAIFCLILVTLCHLDRPLADACWLVTTFLALPLIPAVYFALTRLVGAGEMTPRRGHKSPLSRAWRGPFDDRSRCRAPPSASAP